MGDIRMDLGEIAWQDVEWIHLVQDRNQWWGIVKMVMSH
jgi:hypothetical protein